jgi:hypothetical protein
MRLHIGEVCKQRMIELYDIGVGLEVRDDVYTEIGPEYERVRPIAAGHGVVATPPDQPVGVDAASQGVIAISASSTVGPLPAVSVSLPLVPGR